MDAIEGKTINYQLMRPASEFYLGVEYWNKPEDFPEAEHTNNLRVKVVITQEQAFSFTEMYAADANNGKRLAKSGETLYLLKSQGITSANDRIRNVNYSIVTSPPLQPNSFNERDIEWDYSDGNGTRQYDYGKINISRPLWERDEIHTTSAIVGFPEKETKSVDVEWFERRYFKSKYTVGSTTNSFLKKALELTELTKKYSEKLDKIPFLKRARKNERISNGIGFYFNVTPFEKTVENKEDKNSRLYYTERTIKGGFDAGLSGSTKWTLFGIPYEKLPGPQWVKDKAREYVVVEVYISASANAGGELKVKQVEHKYVESNKWKTISSGVDPALIKLNVALKAGAEISLLKGDSKKIKNDEDEFKWFTLHGSASGTANAELLSIGWVNGNDFDSYFLRKGVWIDIRTNLYAIVVGKKFEVEPFYKKIEIIRPPTD